MWSTVGAQSRICEKTVKKWCHNGENSGKKVGKFGKKCAKYCDFHCKNSEITVGLRGYAQMVFTFSPKFFHLFLLKPEPLQRGIHSSPDCTAGYLL